MKLANQKVKLSSLLVSLTLILQCTTLALTITDSNDQAFSIDQRANDDKLVQADGLYSRTDTTPPEKLLYTSDPDSAIQQLVAAKENQANFSGHASSADILGAVNYHSVPDEQLIERSAQKGGEPELVGSQAKQSVRSKRKLARSHYRLRAHRDTSLSQQQQLASSATISNYSQPFDQAQQQDVPAASGALPATGATTSTTSSTQGGQNDYHHLARALSQTSAASSSSDLPASYSYVSGSPRRAAASLPSASDTSIYTSNSEPLQNQDSDAILDNLAHHALPSQMLHPSLAASGRVYPASIGAGAAAGHRLRAPPFMIGQELPYYLAAPSSSSHAYGDYYGATGAASVPSSISSNYREYDRDHYAPRNYSDQQLEYASDHIPTAFEYPLDSPLSGRSRWSWPWVDSSSFRFNGNAMNTASTLKKHHHHYYHHLKPKDHHHEEHEHLMPKWEHGITVGEIVCVAVAVVLGIIILGSPFFLLFLLLFNGGNLFGATQMGLLAPAAAQAAAVPTAGRRRRRRSVGLGDGGGGGSGEQKGKNKGEDRRIRTSDLVRAGEYLFEKLSPFMDAEKLMHSFERMMDVKDDIEKIITRLGEGNRDHNKDQAWQGDTTDSSRKHDEMRRRRK